MRCVAPWCVVSGPMCGGVLLSSRAAQIFSFDTTIFPQEIPNHWHRTCPEIVLTSARDIQEMLLLFTSKQTSVKETQISKPPLCPCVPLYPEVSPSKSQLCKVVRFEMPSPSHQNPRSWTLWFPFWGDFVCLCVVLPTLTTYPQTTVG